MAEFPEKFVTGPSDYQTVYELVPDQVLVKVSDETDEAAVSAFLLGASFEAETEPEYMQRARRTLDQAGLRWVSLPQDDDGSFAAAEASLADSDDIAEVRPIYFEAEGGPETAATPMFETVMIEIDIEQVEAALEALATLGLRYNEAFSAALDPIYVFDLVSENASDIESALAVAQAAAEVAGVRSVEFDWLKLETYQMTPNDTLFGNQWNMTTISADDAWNTDTGDTNVWIAIIDSGFDLSHPDLDFTPNTASNPTHCHADDLIAGNATPYDAGSSGVFHGTACAGIAAATISNNRGVAGVAGSCQIMPVRLGAVPTSARVAAGINWARIRGAKVGSLSLGTTSTVAAVNAVENAWKAGMILCAATGNGAGNTTSPSINFPANHAKTIAVGASDQNDQRKRPASADGECWGSQFGSEIDVVAPGVRIWTTDEQGGSGYNNNNGGAINWACVNYASSGDGSGDYVAVFNGTSAATPHVAGLAGLILSANPRLGNQGVREVLESTCDKVNPGLYPYANTAGRPNGTWHQEVGYGRINAHQAIQSAVNATVNQGTFTIQQKNTNRFLDAWLSAGKDFSVVTRTAQNNDTQRWILTPIGGVYTIQQKSSGRFMDAWTSSPKDFSAVTRGVQNNDTQRWVLMHVNNSLNTYTMQQLFNGRYMDAWQSAGKDYSAVTRSAQNNDTQRWILSPLGDDTYTIQQKSSSRYLDAWQTSGKDYSVVTRPAQNNDTQRWIVRPVGRVYHIQQKKNGKFLDAWTSSTKDWSAVTRAAQHNNTQDWVLLYLGDDTYTIQQLRNGRHLDAWEHAGKDFSAVTRPRQNNDSQRWILKPV